MKKRIKTAGALTLAAITVLSAAGLSSVYGALGVETNRKCSLTFTLDDDTEFAELRDLEIPVDVYKVADITEEAVYDTAMKFAQARLSPPTIEQIASEAALDTPQSYFDEVISEYRERRDTLIEELNKIEGVLVSKPKGAFYCIAQLPIDNADAFAQWLLESYDLNSETVMVAPAAGFYSTPGMGLNQVRIAYVLKKQDLISAVRILKAAIPIYNATLTMA